MPDFFDIHSHLNFKDYEEDFDEVLERLKETSTHTITIGTDVELSKQAVEIAKNNEGIYACIGVHPVDDPKRVFKGEEFEELVKEKKVVAVGECGLDFFHQDKNNKEEVKRQTDLFLAHIEFALKHDKPIMIHSRNAYAELLDILEPIAKKEGDKLRGDVHFFAGDVEMAKRFFDIGFSVSFTGVLTFTHDYDEVVKFAPLDMIMSETDAPYVSPVPYRGKRNEPAYVSEVVRAIARIRNENFEEVRKAMVENAYKLFSLNS